MIRIPPKVVVLGDCLEVIFDDGRIYKPSRSILCSSPNGKVLWIFATTKTGWKKSKNRPNDSAQSLYEKWSSFEPDREKRIKVSDKGKLKPFGKVKSIVYRSDKWHKNGKKIDYIHTFKRAHYPTLSTDSLKNPGFCRISGGKLAVRSIGITG